MSGIADASVCGKFSRFFVAREGSTALFVLVGVLSSRGRTARSSEGGVWRPEALSIRVRGGACTERRRGSSRAAEEPSGRSTRSRTHVGSFVEALAEFPDVARARPCPRLDARIVPAGAITGVIPGVLPGVAERILSSRAARTREGEMGFDWFDALDAEWQVVPTVSEAEMSLQSLARDPVLGDIHGVEEILEGLDLGTDWADTNSVVGALLRRASGNDGTPSRCLPATCTPRPSCTRMPPPSIKAQGFTVDHAFIYADDELARDTAMSRGATESRIYLAHSLARETDHGHHQTLDRRQELTRNLGRSQAQRLAVEHDHGIEL